MLRINLHERSGIRGKIPLRVCWCLHVEPCRPLAENRLLFSSSNVQLAQDADHFMIANVPLMLIL